MCITCKRFHVILGRLGWFMANLVSKNDRF